MHRTHGEVVDERFAREAPLLTPLRPELTVIGVRATRRVNAEDFVEYRASGYQVPPGHRGRTVVLRDDGERVHIYAVDTLLCMHPTAAGKGQTLRIGTLVPSLQRASSSIARVRSMTR